MEKRRIVDPENVGSSPAVSAKPLTGAQLSYKERSLEQRLVNLLTNWQRNQWARAGYPRGPVAVRKFLEKVKK